MSYSINSPDQWMPWEVFRYYKHKDHPTLLASTAVLLDDFEGRIPEPLVTAALFAFGPGQDFSKFYNWFACIFKAVRSQEHTSELPSQMRLSYAVFCIKKKKTKY